MAQAERSEGIEYSIYTFQGKGKTPAKWEKQDTRPEMAEALALAEKMFSSGDYNKVEVKQKYFDKKQNRNIDVTLKVYESKKREVNVIAVFLFAIACGAAAFAGTYILTR